MWILILLLGIAAIILVGLLLHKRNKNRITISGFAYDPKQDIFYSEMDAWQRKFGYCQLYDEAAAPLGIVFECEPFHFHYDEEKWLIEIWKGQYGMTVGAEMGVYTTSFPELSIPGVFNGTLYDKTDEENHLEMAFSLIKNDEMLFYRQEKHWWLTGFVLGGFAQPNELKMQIKITLKTIAMRDAFVDAMLKVGYTESEILKEAESVYFIFDTPRSTQPAVMETNIPAIAQKQNKMLCGWFNSVTYQMTDSLEKILYVKKHVPSLYRALPKDKQLKKHYLDYALLKKIAQQITK